MKPIWSGSMFVLGACVAALAVATPYRYGAWLDPGAVVAVGGLTLNFGMGPLLVLVHVAKAVLVAAIVPAWRKSCWAGVMCTVVCIPLVVHSMWNAVALLALQRSARVAEASAASERADIVRAELRSIGERLALVGWKPPATVEAEIAAERHHRIWDATSGCTKAAEGGHRQFCARLARLEGTRAAALEAERLRARETELRREIRHLSVPAESRQPDLVLLAAWVGISLDMAENLRTLFWAAVVEIVEIAAFGFAGFFAPSRKELTTPIPARQAVSGATIDANKAPTSSQIARYASTREPAARAGDGESRDQSVSQVSSVQVKQHSAPRDEHEQRQAVDMFVATLRRGAGLRVVGSALLGAYERVREERDWPKIPPNVFGQLARHAVEAAGGHKVKASRQYYVGVALPPAS